MATAPPLDLTALEKDPRLFLYTSLTAGSSHIITATSRLETILKANKIPFQAIDMATDEKARRLWQRRAGGRKLPGLVKEGYVIGDLTEVEEWNEFGELHDNIGPVPAHGAAPPTGGQVGVQIAPVEKHANAFTPIRPAGTVADVGGQTGVPAAKMPEAGFDKTKGIALPGAAEIAALAQKKLAAKKEEAAPAAALGLAKTTSAEKEVDVATSTSPPPSTFEAINAETKTSPRPRQTSISFALEPIVPKTLLEKEKEIKEKAEKKEQEAAKELPEPIATKSEDVVTVASTVTAPAKDTEPADPVAKSESTSSAAKEDKAVSAAAAPIVESKLVDTATDSKPKPTTASENTPAPPTAADTPPSPAAAHHRGSEVHAATPEAITAVEKATTLTEAPEEDAVEEVDGQVAALKLGEGKSEPKGEKINEEKLEKPKAMEKAELEEEKPKTAAAEEEETNKAALEEVKKTEKVAEEEDETQAVSVEEKEEKKTEKADDTVEPKPTQEQDPKSADDATKSVDD